ncbi:hypothetical protein BH09MYX1_BH09MYX1_33250 [soil metagenome]
MEPAVDLTKLSAIAQRILDPKGPAPMKAMAAKGVAPGLKAFEIVTIVAILSENADAKVAETANATLASLPPPLLTGAIVPELPAGVAATLAPLYAKNLDVMERLLGLPQIPIDAVVLIAARCSEAVSELIATNEERLLANPAIIEKLYMNKATRMSTADRTLELAVRNNIVLTGIPAFAEAAAEIVNQLVAEPSPEPTYDDLLFNETDLLAAALPIDPTKEDTHRVDETTGEEVVEEKFLSLEAKLREMTVTQKIRRAMLGTPSERMILVRDANKNIARAAVKSPLIQENEIVRIAASRNVAEDVLSIIARSKDWTQKYQVKLNLVNNPRTPFGFAAKLISHLFEHDLKKLAMSRNVMGAVSTAAKQQLQRKGKM